MGDYPQRSNSSKKTAKQLSVTSLRCLDEAATIFNRSLSDTDYKIWAIVMRGVSDSAIEYAFENWARNGKFFPKPAEIMELCMAYSSQANLAKIKCEPECQQRHGKGYGTNDVLWLLKRRFASREGQWSKNQWERLISELDAKRADGVPEWRR